MKGDKKIRVSIWLSPTAIKQCDAGTIFAGSKSRSDFIERAIGFYSGYLAA